jgi:hypothetical protein
MNGMGRTKHDSITAEPPLGGPHGDWRTHHRTLRLLGQRPAAYPAAVTGRHSNNSVRDGVGDASRSAIGHGRRRAKSHPQRQQTLSASSRSGNIAQDRRLAKPVILSIIDSPPPPFCPCVERLAENQHHNRRTSRTGAAHTAA